MIKRETKVLLASKSPRRKALLEQLKVPYSMVSIEVEENYPSSLKPQQVPLFLAKKKANAFQKKLLNHQVLLTADTVVICNNKILEKAENKNHAAEMLRFLSGKMHQVITGVCLKSNSKIIEFEDITKVYFKKLTEPEINFYIDNYQPFDKAGAYGIQEWIGLAAVTKINGSYFNVVGLPIHKVYESLQKF